MMRTYQTRLANGEELGVHLILRRTLWQGREDSLLSSYLLRRYQLPKKRLHPAIAITARQFNAVRIGVGGKISSIKERRPPSSMNSRRR